MKRILFIIMLVLFCLFPSVGRADSFDDVSIEAYISDHKTQRTWLIARAALEESNSLLHKASQETVSDYRDINKQLDKYTRAFDIIDVLYQSLRTALNVYSTCETITGRVGDYKDLLDQYNSKCLSKGKVDAADLQIITINAKMLENIADDGDELYKSVCDLLLYATGAAACTTSDLILILENINSSLDSIKQHLNQAYFQTWRFIQVRTSYWKAQVYREKTKQEIADSAIGRWRSASKLGK